MRVVFPYPSGSRFRRVASRSGVQNPQIEWLASLARRALAVILGNWFRQLAVEAYGDDDRITFDRALGGTPLLLDGQMQIDVRSRSSAMALRPPSSMPSRSIASASFQPSTAGNFTLQGLTLGNGSTGGVGGVIRHTPIGI